MIQMGTILDVADNSGAKKIACIHLRGGSAGPVRPAGRRDHGLGQGGVARTARSRRAQVVKAVIVRTVKEQRRKDGSYIRFDTNAAVLINDAGEPVGTRVFGPVARELRERKFMKIVSLAPEVI